MSVTSTRYPGAQPFSDDALSRKLFFGREHEATALADEIIANRLIVVYALSGLGKTSLLNAGVAQRLRDEGYLPLIVRVNDVQDGPRASVLQGIAAAAKHQETDYIAGDPASLWLFFKTAEFWRGDLLLTPVLILDQFEELFTLQGPEARMNFLSELGYLVRGVPPPNFAEAHPELSDAAPAMRIVISLREDFLGTLEEVADRIPQILDHRFRLTPLSLPAAGEALTGPAEVNDHDLATRPFRYDPKAVETILQYLSRRRNRTVDETFRNIEPFQLQLICQRFEQIAGNRQRQSKDNVILTIKDIGGEAALRDTLEDFYHRAIAALPGRRVRNAARRLCKSLLISPEGRRLSLEKNEIQRQLRLSSEILTQLVTIRLLRCDNRTDSIYYELSHDALVEPVLATIKARGLLFGSLGLIAGGILWFASATGIVFLIVAVSRGSEDMPELDWLSAIVLFLAVFGFFTFSRMIFVAGLRTIRRYLPHERKELREPDIAPLKDVLLGGLAFVGGNICLSLAAVALIIVVILLGSYLRILPRELGGEDYKLFYEQGPRLDTVVYIVLAFAGLSFGVDTVKWGYRRVWPFRQTTSFEQPITGPSRHGALLLGCLRIIGGGIVMLAVMFLATQYLIEVECRFYWRGRLPEWVPVRWWSLTDLLKDCKKYGDLQDVLLDVFLLFSAFMLTVNWFFRGVRDIRGFLGLSSDDHSSGTELSAG
jgi:hypothetical protein